MYYYSKRFLSALMVLLLSVGLYAQGSLVCKLEMAGMTGSGDNAPFWHTSNRQGLPSNKRNNCYMHFATLGDTPLTDAFEMGYGMDVEFGAGLEKDWFVHELYLDLDYKWLEMSIGMKERWGELKNHRLSTGGLTWSGNSRPIPQILLGIPDYTRIPILGRWFSVKGHIGFGRFTDDSWRKSQSEYTVDKKYTDGLLFHSKDLFVRFGDLERIPFQATIGIELNCVFGGVLHNNL